MHATINKLLFVQNYQSAASTARNTQKMQQG